MFGTTFENTAQQNKDVVFAKYNTDEEEKLSKQFGVNSIPTIIAFKNGEEKFHKIGVLSEL